MKLFDAHCDALMKLWLNPALSFMDSPDLHVNLKNLKKSSTKVQCMAIYIPEEVPMEARFNAALEMIDLFYEKVLPLDSCLKQVCTKQQILSLQDHEIGLMLTLEGCDSIGTSIERLRTLYRLGVSSVGLTWNYANAVADGILEGRGAGLTQFGKEVVAENNRYGVWTDVSHLSERGFWEVMDSASYPIASHSNSFKLCSHPRNLKDEQIKALIDRNAVIGITFVPQFLKNDGRAAIKDVISHIDYICSLGGESHIGLGSDFDGITETVKGLKTNGMYPHLMEELAKHYSASQIEGFSWSNFVSRLPR